MRRAARALLAFVLLSAALGYLIRLPGAIEIGDAAPTAAHVGERLVLGGVQGSILTIAGAPGASTSILAPDASLDDATWNNLAALGQAVTRGRAPMQWTNLGGGGGGATITLRFPPAPAAGIEFLRTSNQQSFEVQVRPRGAALLIDAVVPYSSDKRDDTVLRIAQQSIVQHGGGALPITLVVPDGETAQIRLANDAAQASQFILGEQAKDGTGNRMRLQTLSILNDSGEREALCGAPLGEISWRLSGVTRASCSPTLSATRLLADAGVGLDIVGSAYRSDYGSVTPSPFIDKVREQPLVAGLLGAISTGIVAWLIRSFLPEKRKGSSRPARRRARPRGSGEDA